MEIKIDKKSRIVLIVVLIVTVIVSILGVTYAYFMVVINSGNTSSMLIRASKLEITYQESKNISGDGVEPGWSDTKVFTIKNTGTKILNYNLVFTDVINTLVYKNYLVYSLVGTGSGAYNTAGTLQFPSADQEIGQGISIDPGVTHNYTMTINYINDEEFDQSDDMSKIFVATISIETDDISD